MQRLAKVCLELDSRPGFVTLVRAMLSATSETLGFEPELLDDLKTAVSEACNNVVMHAYDGGAGPMDVRLFADEQRIRVRVTDRGVGRSPEVGDQADGIGLSVIRALADE